MARFIVDRVLPGVTPDVLAEAQRCLQQAARRVTADGDTVTYLRCTFIPDQQRCLDLFEAVSADEVRRVNDIAQLPFRSIGQASEDTFARSRRVTAPRHRRSRSHVMTEHSNTPAAIIRRHPLSAFFVWFFTVGQAFAFAPRFLDTDIAQQWFINGATIFGLLLPAVVITAVVDGREGLRSLRRRITKLGGPAGVYVVGFVAMPLLALAMAAALLGAPTVPVATLVTALITGLLVSVVVGLLLNNLWEEVAWMGFVQARLQDRHGPLRAVLIVAPLFALQHIAMLLQDDPVSSALLFVVAILVMIPFRALIAWTYNRTGGSLLVVGLVHAFGNAMGAGAGFGTSYLQALYPDDGAVVSVLHTAAIAVIGLVLIAATRGRLGLPPRAAESAHVPVSFRDGLAAGPAR